MGHTALTPLPLGRRGRERGFSIRRQVYLRSPFPQRGRGLGGLGERLSTLWQWRAAQRDQLLFIGPHGGPRASLSDGAPQGNGTRDHQPDAKRDTGPLRLDEVSRMRQHHKRLILV